MNWIEVNNTALRHELAGTGPATLVLIHEMGGTLDSWDAVMPVLINGRQILRYDTRGAGLSQKIKGEVTWDQIADDLAGLLDALGITGKVALAGIAVGAAIAVHFAARYPARAAALVLHGPAVGVSADRRQATLDRARDAETLGIRAMADSAMASSYPPIVRHDQAVFAAFRARWLSNDPESYAAINRMLANESIEHELDRLTCPTLLTAGRHDTLRPPALIRPMAERVPDGRFQELDTGHFASVQTPGLMAEAIQAFLHPLGY